MNCAALADCGLLVEHRKTGSTASIPASSMTLACINFPATRFSDS